MMDLNITCRMLTADDVPTLQAFLRERTATSMFLLSNLRQAGMEDYGQRYQGTYFGVFRKGQLVGVAAHYWNGNIMLQAPEHLRPLLDMLLQTSDRPVEGIIGPAEQVTEACALVRERSGVVEARFDGLDGLYALPLSELQIPAQLAEARVHGRRATADDVDLLTRWRMAYCVETLGATDDADLRDRCRSDVITAISDRNMWVLHQGQVLVACSAFNARLPEAVQVGGVWTPPELRSRGYGRCVVAASLRDAQAEGVQQAILFTGDENVPAIRAYQALGFRRIGDYRLIFFSHPVAMDADVEELQ